MKRKICVITGSRAEYGLLYGLMKEIQADPDLKLQTIATGAHLSPEFGLTYRDIERDGFRIDSKVEMLLSSDTPVGISKSMGIGMIGFADAFEKLKPDILVVLGDRYEIFAACIAALPSRLPIAHIHGGETTRGAIDEAIRHAITKMAHLHFAAAEVYRRRIIQMGEDPRHVFCVRAPGLERIQKIKFMTRKEFGAATGFRFGSRNLLVTFHPVTLESRTSAKQFAELLAALDSFRDVRIIFTKPNADTEGRILLKMIDHYVRLHPDRTEAFTSLGQVKYLSALSHVDAVVGNSSSGIIEAPFLKIPTVNIGDRQAGRAMAKSVICCRPQRASIKRALQRACSKEFRHSLREMRNPYEGGMGSGKIKNILKRVDLNTRLLKKVFYDIH